MMVVLPYSTSNKDGDDGDEDDDDVKPTDHAEMKEWGKFNLTRSRQQLRNDHGTTLNDLLSPGHTMPFGGLMPEIPRNLDSKVATYFSFFLSSSAHRYRLFRDFF